MASISREKNGHRTIQFVDASGTRRSLRLGKISQRDAEGFKIKIEALLAARMAGRSPEAEVSRWLVSLPSAMHRRLAKLGLVEARAEATLQAFITGYVNGRADVKPATKEIWSQGKRGLVDFFQADRALRQITAGQADQYKQHLLARGLAPMTVRKRLQFAKTIFRAAERHRLIDENPFAEVGIKASMRDRSRFVTGQETAALLAAAPDHHWRSIIALARFGGLRCPSEVLSLRWQDIDWAAGRVIVTAPKTEHHPGKETRTIPLFASLRPVLAEALELAPAGAVYVVDERFRKAAFGPAGWRNCNLRTTFEKIVGRAGLTAWPRPFHNLRASCETELTQEHPLPVVIAWLGHSADVALKHYCQVTDADFKKAIGGPTGALQNPVQQLHETARNPSQPLRTDLKQSPHQQDVANSRERTRNLKADGEGFEPPVRFPVQQFSRLPP
jgi:integrase